jgi:predicted DNA-binding transcriptional regulator YafY
MQSSRLLSILLRLQSQGQVSARALAEALEVSVRTIYRDIDALSAAGVPVYALPGRQGGLRLRDGYRTELTGLDAPEAEALFLAGAPQAAAQLGLGDALERTRLKLLAALPASAQREARRVAERFHLDPVGWFQGPDEQQLLPALAVAVWSGRGLQMRYERWQGEVDRQVAPLGLVLKAGLWYLVAAVDGQPRTYRVSSIRALQITEPVPAPRVPFDLPGYWRQFTQDYEARMQSGQAQVRANADGLRALARLSHATAQAVASASQAAADSAGWRTLTMPMESVAAASAELLRLAPDVQALGPPALLQALQAAVQGLQALYGSAAPKR